MATGAIDDDPQESQSDPQEHRSSWDDLHSSLLSKGRSSRRDEPSSRREMLHNLADQYYAEKRRADDAERMLQELTIHLKAINDARLQALHDAAKANEELKLYKIQLKSAQNEIYKAQDVIEAVDLQRYSAEKEAAKFRSKARQLHETILMSAAREEAWKLGLQEGLNRGRGQSNGENRFVEYSEEHALDDDSFDESISDTDVNTFPARPPSFDPSIQNRPPSRTHPSPAPPPSNPPTVAHSIHPSENIRPMSIRSGHTRASSRQRIAPSPAPVPVLTNRPPSSQSIRPSENVRPVSIRSGYTQPSLRQRVSPSPVPSNTRPSSQYESSRPVNIRPTTPIPPDNFIPSLGADNKIRIPPPFEFHRPVTPERSVSPQAPAMSDSSQEALILPRLHAKAPQQRQKRYHRRHSSSGSNSSSLSNLDIINDHPPIGVGTPMSVIPEVLSVQSTASQLPDGDHHSRRQRSFSENSTHTLNLNNSQHLEAQTHLRPHSRSSYAGSTRNARQQAELHSDNSYGSSPPNIDIQPPSHGSSKASLAPHNGTLPTMLESHGSLMSVPGSYQPVLDPRLSPVHSRRYIMNSRATNDDNAVSSGIGSDPLTTPPVKGHVSIEPDWSGAAASAAHIPLLPHR